ncbi:TolC family outer membrane protein [Amphibiibacter pelophylacis]|uniref:TolC family outer membrane protein n=1 Tax=Amphibiibacter pelophylacis TaxID=1799477 RepID=A0ACC6P0H2_9BURK
MPTAWRRGVLAAAVLLAAGGAQAQSLHEVLAQALQSDATWRAAQAQAASVPYKVEQARAALRPQLGLTGSATVQAAETPDSQTAKSAQKLGLALGVSAQQSLYNRASSLTVEKAQRGQDIARATLEAARQDLIQRVSQAYFDVLTAQSAVRALESALDAAQGQLKFATRNFEVGNATVTDSRQAQAQVDVLQAQLLSARNTVQTRQLALAQITGQADVTPWELKPTALADKNSMLAVRPETVDEWVALAESLSPAVQQAALAAQSAELDVALARAQDAPTLALVGQVGVARDQSRSRVPGAGWVSGSARSGTGQVGVNFNMPLYTGGLNDNRLRETLALLDAARQQQEAARRSVTQATRTAFYTLRSTQAQALALRTAVSSAELLLKAARLGYEVGMNTSLDVLNAQNQVYQTRRDLDQARYGALSAYLGLRRAAGAITDQDLAELDDRLQPAKP